MRHEFRRYRQQINLPFLLDHLRPFFQKIPDQRAANIVFQLPDVLMAALAMFVLKYPSLLSFERQTKIEKHNLQHLFQLNHICSDAQMRRILDQVPPEQIDQLFNHQFEHLQQAGLLNDHLFLKKYLLLSIDGVEFFRSKSIHCQNCQQTRHTNGEVSYSHPMLAAVVVHPLRKEVYPIANEAIQKQDGHTKNDCELNASKRLQARLAQQFSQQPFLIIEDALYANEPHIQQILDNNWQYIITAKPTHRKKLFTYFETLKKQKKTKKHRLTIGNTTHHFEWIKRAALNQNGLRTNLIVYQEFRPKGKKQTFSWITSLNPTKSNILAIMQAARARWKIENETFNTLKNQGYHFEHNYGHGKQFLAHVLASLMLLAFLLDQLIQASNKNFQKIWEAAKTKIKLWEHQRALFMTTKMHSFEDLMIHLAYIFDVQLE